MSDITINLNRFQYTPNMNNMGRILELEGSPDGLLNTLLDFLGMTEKTQLLITTEELSFKFSGLAGVTQIVAPVSALTCAVTGVWKPLRWLFIGIFLVLVAVASLFMRFLDMPYTIMALGLGAWLIYYYYRTKFLILTFSTGDIGDVRGLRFRATSIDGKEVNMTLLIEAIQFINHYMVVREEPLSETLSDEKKKSSASSE